MGLRRCDDANGHESTQEPVGQHTGNIDRDMEREQDNNV
jgi:hypothetical protein